MLIVGGVSASISMNLRLVASLNVELDMVSMLFPKYTSSNALQFTPAFAGIRVHGGWKLTRFSEEQLENKCIANVPSGAYTSALVIEVQYAKAYCNTSEQVSGRVRFPEIFAHELNAFRPNDCNEDGSVS